MQGNEGDAEIAGQVKWFDAARGFGFVLDDAGGSDVLLHANVLRNFGQGSVADGARIRLRVVPTARGRQAVEVLELAAAQPGGGPPPIADLAQHGSDRLASLPFLPGRVKWFHKAKGFGFANVFGEPEDVFLHLEVVRHGGFADLTPGEAVALKVVEGRRGPMAAQIASWDRAREAGPEAGPRGDAEAERRAEPDAGGPERLAPGPATQAAATVIPVRGASAGLAPAEPAAALRAAAPALGASRP